MGGQDLVQQALGFRRRQLKRVLEEDAGVEGERAWRVVELLARSRGDADGIAMPGLRQVAVHHALSKYQNVRYFDTEELA